MLIRFSVKNYRSFRDELVLDFTKTRDYQFNTECILHDCVGKMIIYGRNGTGKTNLGRALEDICTTLLYPGRNRIDSSFLNADSAETEVSFGYTFSFDGEIVDYKYNKSQDRALTYETLQINGKTIFTFDHIQNCLIENALSSLGFDTLQVDHFTASDEDAELAGSFLSWIRTNSLIKGTSSIGKLFSFVRGMDVEYLSAERLGLGGFSFLSDEKRLKQMEFFFNALGVPCSLEVRNTPDGRPQLYYKYNNGLVRFEEAASSGAKKLYRLYTSIFCFLHGTPSFLYLDEFDAFFHYEMSEKLVKYLIDNYPDTQIILTSHNTNLISNSLLRPDCYLILSQDGRLTPLCDATNRELREGHNLEKMYISGEFERYE